MSMRQSRYSLFALGLVHRLEQPIPWRRGAALIWAMTLFAVMAASVVEFMYTTRVNIGLAAQQRSEVIAYFNARSGINLQMLAIDYQHDLAQDPLVGTFVSRSRFQLWQWFEQLLPAFSSGTLATPIGGLDLTQTDAGGIGGFQGEIEYTRPEPEEGKINVNRFSSLNLDREMVVRFCNMLAPGEFRSSMSISESRSLEERFEVIAAIIDHVDPDSDLTTIDANCEIGVGGRGNESSRYDDFDWGPKDQPLVTLEEMSLVPGVTRGFLDQYHDNITVYPLASNDINLNLADAVDFAGLLCANFRGADQTSFSPCDVPGIGLEVLRVSVALDGYVRFFEDPMQVLMFYLQQGMGGSTSTGAEAVPTGRMQPFRNERELRSVLTQVMTNPQWELFFAHYADPRVRQMYQQIIGPEMLQLGTLPPLAAITIDDFDIAAMRRSVTTDAPQVFTVSATGRYAVRSPDAEEGDEGAYLAERNIEAVVKQEGDALRVLSWREY